MFRNQEAAGFAQLAKMIAASRGDQEAFRVAAGRGMVPFEVQAIAKNAVAGQSLSDLGDYQRLMQPWVEALASQSVFFRLVDYGSRRIPFDLPLLSVASNATGWIVGEGNPIPLSRVSLSGSVLRPVRAVAMLATTTEFARSASPYATAALDTELQAAVARVVDSTFLSGLIDTVAPVVAASGTSPQAALDDLRALLNAVNTAGSPASGLLFVASPDVANSLASLPDLFPNMGPAGGEILNVPAMVTDVLAEGEIALIRGRDVATAFSTIELDASGQATVEMDSDPSGDASAAMVSMYQAGLTVLRATVYFNFERLKADAVALITGADYHAGDGGSPA